MPVWQKAHTLSLDVFRITAGLPLSEDFCLTSQIRKSSNGVAACIAEGFGRNTNKDKSYFYFVAKGSSFETQNHLLYGKGTGYFDQLTVKRLLEEYDDLIFELNKLIKSLK